MLMSGEVEGRSVDKVYLRMRMRRIVDAVIRGGRRCKHRRRIVWRWLCRCGRRGWCWGIDWSGPFEQTLVVGRCVHKPGKLEREVLCGKDVVWDTEDLEGRGLWVVWVVVG